MTQPLVTLAAIRRALSPARIAAYATAADRDEIDAVARYLWNASLATCLHPSLHALEVTLRNALYDASSAHVEARFRQRRRRDIHCWMDCEPSFLLPSEQAAVEKAKERMGEDLRSRTAGHLVAKLGFGFWVALCRRPYDSSRGEGPRLWPTLLPRVFPYLPAWVGGREDVYERLEKIRALRNRAAHHDPLWDRDVGVQHALVLDTLGWMNPPMVRAVRALDPFPAAYAAGPGGFRGEAETLLVAAERSPAAAPSPAAGG
jgi:hypothetical protein